MKAQISPQLLAHFAKGSTTVCTCWRVALVNGPVYGFTDHDHDLVINSVNYIARSGFNASSFESQTALAVDNSQAVGMLSAEVIDPVQLASGVWDFAAIEVFMVNWQDLGQGRDILMTAHLGNVSQERTKFTAELRGLTNAFTQKIGTLYQPNCRVDFCSAKCGLNIYEWTVDGTLTGVQTNGLVLLDTARTEPGPQGAKAITGITNAAAGQVTVPGHGLTAAGQVIYLVGILGMTELNGQFCAVKAVVDANAFTISMDTTSMGAYASGGTMTVRGEAGYFDFGVITMQDGSSAGLSMEVKGYSVGTITLQMGFPQGVAIGDKYTMTAGCAKRFTEDCVGRFSNGINFRGEPHLPGIDSLMRTGGQ